MMQRKQLVGKISKKERKVSRFERFKVAVEKGAKGALFITATSLAVGCGSAEMQKPNMEVHLARLKASSCPQQVDVEGKNEVDVRELPNASLLSLQLGKNYSLETTAQAPQIQNIKAIPEGPGDRAKWLITVDGKTGEVALFPYTYFQALAEEYAELSQKYDAMRELAENVSDAGLAVGGGEAKMREILNRMHEIANEFNSNTWDVWISDSKGNAALLEYCSRYGNRTQVTTIPQYSARQNETQ